MSASSRSFTMTKGRWRIATALVACIATLAVVATYPVFSQTWDEPATLAAGMEWLSEGRYTYEAHHPPLARIAAAAGPYLGGARSTGNRSMYEEGRTLLGEGPRYRRALFLARLGMLPFFWLLLAVCAVWGARVAGPPGAALATIFAATNPNLLAHAGIAGTDLAPAAFVAAGLLAWIRWRETPSFMRALVFGLAFGLAMVTKFSALAFLGLAIAMGEAVRLLVARRADPALERARFPWQSALTVLAATSLAVWSVYRFQVGPLATGGVPIPAPEFFRGVHAFLTHGSGGHPAFMFGDVRLRGWWYYYLVVLAVKTPLPLLTLAIVGAVQSVRRARDNGWPSLIPLVGVFAVLVPTLVSRVDLGVRIVLAIYPFLALLAARGAIDTWRGVGGGVGAGVGAGAGATRVARRMTVALLIFISLAIPVRAWPDYLAYFNPVAGSHPERVLVDSNLDWGQDLYRLADTVRARRIDSLRIHYFGSANLSAVGLNNARRLARDERTTGWVAASETFLAGVWTDTSLHWLARATPVARIGPSMRLYYFEPDTSRRRLTTSPSPSSPP